MFGRRVNGSAVRARKSVSNGAGSENRNPASVGKNGLPRPDPGANVCALYPGTGVTGKLSPHHLVTLMPIAVGSKAPDFTLKTRTAGVMKDVTLSDSFGKTQTVLLFFPAAFTSVCTAEMCDVSGGVGEYAKLDAQVYGISVDGPATHEAWAKQNNLGITLLSDQNKTVIKAYDVVLPALFGLYETAARAAVVIGKDGIVKYAEKTPTPKDLPNFGAVKAALAR
jgi:peroxiredoxin